MQCCSFTYQGYEIFVLPGPLMCSHRGCPAGLGVLFDSGAKAGHRHWKTSAIIDIYCIRERESCLQAIGEGQHSLGWILWWEKTTTVHEGVTQSSSVCPLSIPVHTDLRFRWQCAERKTKKTIHCFFKKMVQDQHPVVGWRMTTVFFFSCSMIEV